MQRYHYLKIVSDYFDDVKLGYKKAELRKNDRDFRVGDFMVLQEISNDSVRHFVKYTGRTAVCKITHVLTDTQFGGLQDGFCIISFLLIDVLEASQKL